MSRTHLADIRGKRPDHLSVGDLSWLVNEVETLTRDRDRARSREGDLTKAGYGRCILIDATGHERVQSGLLNGYSSWPRSIRLPLRTQISFIGSVDVLPEASVAYFREFKLVGERRWDGMPIYEEVVP